MNWDAVGAFAETISAIAVVVTFVFLTIQLRQNTRAIEHRRIAPSSKMPIPGCTRSPRAPRWPRELSWAGPVDCIGDRHA